MNSSSVVCGKTDDAAERAYEVVDRVSEVGQLEKVRGRRGCARKEAVCSVFAKRTLERMSSTWVAASESTADERTMDVCRRVEKGVETFHKDMDVYGGTRERESKDGRRSIEWQEITSIPALGEGQKEKRPRAFCFSGLERPRSPG